MRFLSLLIISLFAVAFSGCHSEVIGPSDTKALYQWALYQNYPNPFTDTTVITYTVPMRTYVSLTIYDKYHNLVRTMAYNRFHPDSTHSLTWDGRDDNYKRAEPGIYIVELWGAQPEQYQKRIIAVRK